MHFQQDVFGISFGRAFLKYFSINTLFLNTHHKRTFLVYINISLLHYLGSGPILHEWLPYPFMTSSFIYVGVIVLNLFNNFIKKKNKLCVIAEKYSAAADYAKVFKCNKKDNYFEGENYVIVWTNGHVCTLYNPEDYNEKFKVWKMEDLPIAPNGFWVKVRPGKGKVINLIKEIIERQDITAVCVATDSAREGNLIGEYTLMAIENKKKVYRAMISALNEKEIKLGFKNMREDKEYKSMTLAAEARDEIDWLIGTNLSRAYSVLYNKKYYVGRCKTVILNLLCKREEEINAFKESLSYGIVASFANDEHEYAGRLNYTIETELEAKKIINVISNSSGEVIDISREVKSIEPDQLYNLNDLIRAANRRFGYTADEVYNLSQELYEKHKLISYARTDCRYIKSSMITDMNLILNCINVDKFNSKKNSINDIKRFVKRCVDDEKVVEHTAIIPLAIDSFDEKYKLLNLKEKNVYDIILENFINNFLENYEYESIVFSTQVKNYTFVTRQIKIISYGWNDDNNQGKSIVDVSIGERVNVKDSIIEKKLSRPKDRYTDNTLFEILENPGKFVEDTKLKKILKESGIGTNATRALLLNDLMANGYVTRDKKYIIPTIDGLELIQDIKTDKLLEPMFTAVIEQQLQQIQDGKLEKDEVVKNIIKFLENHIEELKSNINPNTKNNVIGKCPVCKNGKIVRAGDKGYGCTNLKSIGCRFYISKEILGAYIDENQVKKLIENKQTDMLNFKGKKGDFSARIIIDGNKTKFKKN